MFAGGIVVENGADRFWAQSHRQLGQMRKATGRPSNHAAKLPSLSMTHTIEIVPMR
jgi:hypothetical protein